MCGFITNSGTVYYVDSVNKLFSGGKFKNPVQYTSLSAVIGSKATIVLAQLATGSVLWLMRFSAFILNVPSSVVAWTMKAPQSFSTFTFSLSRPSGEIR